MVGIKRFKHIWSSCRDGYIINFVKNENNQIHVYVKEDIRPRDKKIKHKFEDEYQNFPPGKWDNILNFFHSI